MPLYNVCAGVVANIEADAPEDAQQKLDRALDRAGFQTLEGIEGLDSLKPFLAEEGTEPSDLPDPPRLAR